MAKEPAYWIDCFILELGNVPTLWYEAQPKPVAVTQDDYYAPPMAWWVGQEPASNVEAFCDSHFSPDAPVGYYMMDGLIQRGWTDEHGHHFDLIENENGEVLELTAKIDVKKPYSDFVDNLVRFVIDAHCLLYNFEAEKFLDPRREPITRAISLHPFANAFVDPSGVVKPN